ncbi:helix-turn-helix domain-containing protein [Nocardia brasiliensis]|uniref:Helix-turn-helix domain-containing protein n=1 Tax=Nocardia brasiliensis TaxID=37326 RepID=A0A6G9Y0K0_NOCBR|nr:helix-turn-helix domain-containing protein [Nocardia brasiliensis]QIS06711.1 helix-turn-helix domain-containing protein [Nocardia brasiliensis]
MGGDRLGDLRGTYQVRAHQIVTAPPTAFAGLAVLRGFGFDVFEPNPVRRRKIPGGTVKLVFALDGIFDGRSIDPTALVIGLHDRAGTAGHAGRMRSVQLQLDPLTARGLLGVPLDELRNQAVPLTELFGRPVRQLTERLAETPTWPARFTLLGDYLRQRACDNERTADRAIGHAVRELRRSDGIRPVTALAAESGWSQRHFRRRFAAEVGLPPKDYASLLRFSAALTAMTTHPWHDPSALAAEFGYYDQSHLTRDFHRFAGTSPGRLLSRSPIQHVNAPGCRNEAKSQCDRALPTNFDDSAEP